MVIKFLKKLLEYLEKKEKVENVKKQITNEEREFIEKQKRIKQDFQKMMNYNVTQAIGKREG